ncbi:MAG TPA: FAD-dependent oxidoreductase [Sulfuriferula sp.]|nr:FAD-dependent oxidoreductase [Sulfuriferula sp.]
MSEFHEYLIVGAGLAGASAAEAIRELDADGSVLMLGAEPAPPYHRPPLSKGLWLGKDNPDDIFVKTAEQWLAFGVTLRVGDTAIALDADGKHITTASGARIDFGKLLLATGGTPRSLAAPPALAGRIHGLRTLADYHLLRSLAHEDAQVLIVGGSFIGAEMACALAAQPGVGVSMIFPGAAPLARILPPSLAQVLVERYRAHGVSLYAGDRVAEFSPCQRGIAARTEQGVQIEADWVLAGVGLDLNLALAQSAGLAVDNGVRVNARLQTGHDDIYAAGDIANYPDRVWGEAIRTEHWDHAQASGRAAGRNMVGADEPYTHQSMFFSDLFDIGFEAVGTLSSQLETCVDMADQNKGVVYYLQDNQVRGVLLWNTWDQVDAARELIAARQLVTVDGLMGQLG